MLSPLNVEDTWGDFAFRRERRNRAWLAIALPASIRRKLPDPCEAHWPEEVPRVKSLATSGNCRTQVLDHLTGSECACPMRTQDAQTRDGSADPRSLWEISPDRSRSFREQQTWNGSRRRLGRVVREGWPRAARQY